jgi:DNA-binding Lrp family transcriptional regulator
MSGDPLELARSGPGSLDDRVLTALQGLPGRIAFNGLRRALGAHPESLSRSLRRLEREGLVERVDGGYRALALADGGSARAIPPLRSIARVGLPPGTPPETVLGRLAGRWFGGLRWIGVVDRPDGRLLGWTRRDGTSPVLVAIRDGVLHVLVPEEETEGDDASESEDAAYELLVHAVGALRPVPESSTRSVVALTASGAPPIGSDN